MHTHTYPLPPPYLSSSITATKATYFEDFSSFCSCCGASMKMCVQAHTHTHTHIHTHKTLYPHPTWASLPTHTNTHTHTHAHIDSLPSTYLSSSTLATKARYLECFSSSCSCCVRSPSCCIMGLTSCAWSSTACRRFSRSCPRRAISSLTDWAVLMALWISVGTSSLTWHSCMQTSIKPHSVKYLVSFLLSLLCLLNASALCKGHLWDWSALTIVYELPQEFHIKHAISCSDSLLTPGQPVLDLIL